jgi:HD-like signal output (HDOD) protein
MPSLTSPASALPAIPSALAGWEAWLQAALDARLDLPPLSKASAAIAAMAADGDANTAVLAQLVERDPTVAANVLRVANSAALAPRIPIVTMGQAIAWLGMGEIQSIAMAVAVRSRLFSGAVHETPLKEMWRTAVATAYWAREIARPSRIAVDLAHLCGLLHRIGRPVVVRCLAHAPDGSESRLTSLQRATLVDRMEAAAGTALCGVWNLPEPVSTTIGHWRDESYTGPWERQIRQVRLASLLASRSLGAVDDDLAGERRQAAIEALKMTADEIAALQASEAAVQQALVALD